MTGKYKLSIKTLRTPARSCPRLINLLNKNIFFSHPRRGLKYTSAYKLHSWEFGDIKPPGGGSFKSI